MSTLEVKAPYITGLPGRTHLDQGDAGQGLGVLLRQGTGQRHRRHGACQGEGG